MGRSATKIIYIYIYIYIYICIWPKQIQNSLLYKNCISLDYLFILPILFFIYFLPSFPLNYGPKVSFLVFLGTFGEILLFILSLWGSLWCRSSVGSTISQFLLYTGQLRVQITPAEQVCSISKAKCTDRRE